MGEFTLIQYAHLSADTVYLYTINNTNGMLVGCYPVLLEETYRIIFLNPVAQL